MQYFITFSLACGLVLLTGCGNNNKPARETGPARVNAPADQEKARQVTKDLYSALLDLDSLKLTRSFSEEIQAHVHELLDIIRERSVDWGELATIHIPTVETSCQPNGDCRFTATIQSRYEYNESNDVLEITCTKNGKSTVVGYELKSKQVTQCSAEKLELLKPMIQQLAQNLANKKDDSLTQAFQGTDRYAIDFRQHVLETRNTFFPASVTAPLKASWHNGYLRQYCGTKNGSNGFLTFKIALGDTAERYITFFMSTYVDEDGYELYSVLMSRANGYNLPRDQALAKQLTQSVFDLLQQGDEKRFYALMHPEARFTDDQKPLTLSVLKAVMQDFNDLGTFSGYEKIITHTVLESHSGKLHLRYVVLARVHDTHGKETLVELSFKPDEKGDIRLMGFEEM